VVELPTVTQTVPFDANPYGVLIDNNDAPLVLGVPEKYVTVVHVLPPFNE
jgi:hypothetical protein